MGLTNIVGNFTTREWKILSRKELGSFDNVLAFTASQMYNNPLGRIHWRLRMDCNSLIDDFQPKILKLTKVYILQI